MPCGRALARSGCFALWARPRASCSRLAIFSSHSFSAHPRRTHRQVLFEELAKLQRFTPRLEDYPHRLTYDQDVKTLEGESTPGMDTIETTRRRAARRRRE